MSGWTGPKTGALFLGMFFGYVAMYFIVRFEQFDTKVLGAFFGAVLGGSIVQFISDRKALPYYPVGLVIGLAIYILARMFGGPNAPTFNF